MRFLILPLMLVVVAMPVAAMAQRAAAPAASYLMAPAGADVLKQDPAPQMTAKASTPQMAEGIVAVVNDGIITTADLRGRIALSLLSAGLPDTSEVREKLVPQVLRSLVDEQLQLQKGASLGITITEPEIEATMQRLAVDNKIPGGDMVAFMTANGVPPSALRAQVKAGMTWGKVIQREIRPRIDVGDDEIDAALQRIRANAGKQEYLLSEIFLTVDQAKDEEQVKNFADDLVQQLKGGAVFGSVARQFSQGTGAATGGDMGWVQLGQLSPEIDSILETMQPSEISNPIRTANGFHILGMREKRLIALGDPKEARVKLQQVFRPFSTDQTKESLLIEAENLRKSLTTCDNLSEKISTNFSSWRWQDLGEVKLSEAPTWLSDKVKDVAEGQTSEAMATDRGALILFVCGRSVPENINRQEIMSSIGQERMELSARRMMRDLRRNAHLDLRIKP